MLEQDARNAKTQRRTQAKVPPTKEAIIHGLKSRISELEMAMEELQQNPPLPSRERLTRAMKDDDALIPEFVKPVIPVPQQTKHLKELDELLVGIVTNVDEAKKIVARLKRGIRTPPMGR